MHKNNIISLCVPYHTSTSETFYVDVEIDYQLPNLSEDESDWDYYGCFDIVSYSTDYPDEIKLNKLKQICREYIRELVITQTLYLD